jgi:predicted component of type VI protein secretion system
VGGRVLATFATAAILIAGCGEDDFENEPRAPVRLELSGVVQADRVTVSPSRALGAGPFEITLSNQTEDAHTITLEGESIVTRAGSVEPGDTVTIRRTLEPGSYELRAGSEQAVREEIEPAVIDVGAERENSNTDLLLP